jgi:UDP-N-acetylglucosamine acyltransferase
MASEIHPTAILSPGAELGTGVVIGPYSVIGPSVQVGDGTRIGPHVVIEGVTSIGADNVIVGQANLGGAPQDFSYRGEPTMLRIGDRNMIREFVTVNRGTLKGGAITSIGSDCLLMACCHVAHDCEIGDKVILANNVMLAGHARVGKGASISGGSGGQQFVTIGDYAYVGGMTRCVQDVPPFMIVEGHPSRVRGVNVIGLARAGFPEEDIEALRVAFRRIYRSGHPRARSIELLRSDPSSTPQVIQLLDSLEQTEQGAKGRYREILREQFARLGQERIYGAARAH